jgi:hypothetical protein
MEEDAKSQSREPACVASLVMLTCASNVGKWRSFAMTTRATALLALGLGPPMHAWIQLDPCKAIIYSISQ